MPDHTIHEYDGPLRPADDLLALLPRRTAAVPQDDGPVYYLWRFNPVDGKTTVDHNEGRRRAHTITHEDMSSETDHPESINGYAYRIVGGWRITDAEHKKLADPFVIKSVIHALRVQEPPKPLPHVTIPS